MSYTVTAEIGQLIQAGKAAGKSNRLLAAEIEAATGVKIDQRTVGRYIHKIVADPGSKPPKPRKTKSTGPKTLDELTKLHESVERIEKLLENASALPPRDVAALSAELRQTFKAIRNCQKADLEAIKTSSDDLDFVKSRLRKFAEEKDVDRSDVSDVARASVG